MFNQEYKEGSIVFGEAFEEEGITSSQANISAFFIEYLIDAAVGKVDN